MDEETGRTFLTVSTSDSAVAYCLGALHLWSVPVGERPLSRETVEWVPGKRTITLIFPSAATEQQFLTKATELLPTGSWSWSRLHEE